VGARDDFTFDPERHEYRFLGAVVPGVTEILRPLVDFSGIQPAVLEAKRDLGRRVHLACQLDDEHDLDEASVEADVAPYLAAWRRFLVESGAEVLHNERRVLEPALQYAGTLDNVLRIDGRRWLVDKKTSIATPASAGPQTAAYLRALGDRTVTHRAAVRLRPDGTYRFDPLDGADDWAVFMSCLTVHRFKERHAS
jgi:hypothetical protein